MVPWYPSALGSCADEHRGWSQVKLLNSAVGRWVGGQGRIWSEGWFVYLFIHVEGNLRNSCFAAHSALGTPACNARVRCVARYTPTSFVYKAVVPDDHAMKAGFPLPRWSSGSAVAGNSSFPSPPLPFLGLLTHVMTPAVFFHSWII